MSALPYLKFAGPSLDEATIAGVGDVLRSGHIASGPWVQKFEARLSDFCGGRPVRVLTSATAAVKRSFPAGFTRSDCGSFNPPDIAYFRGTALSPGRRR